MRLVILLLLGSFVAMADSNSNTTAIIHLLETAKQESGTTPALSPLDTMLGDAAHEPVFDAAAVQAAGFPVIVWTVNKAERMRELLERRVDGIISDRPDLLMAEVNKLSGDYRNHFDAEAHRGGRDLRPENTLPSFESGLDNLVTTLETDTGVTKDGVSLISHEQFINPQTCRAVDGSDYGESNRVWINEITMPEAQRRFICDKVFRGPEQKNDPSLSPVSVAFAREHHMASPYAPTFAGQLFEFVEFYVNYYRAGAGKDLPQARDRWQHAVKVHFNLETKISPNGHSDSPQKFVDALCGVISTGHMEARADVQSFDFRTLKLIGKQFPKIRTVYLIESMRWQQMMQQ